jgi:hypothetical protein
MCRMIHEVVTFGSIICKTALNRLHQQELTNRRMYSEPVLEKEDIQTIFLLSNA